MPLIRADACTNTCKLAVCGDGYLHEGVEACDDGDDDDTDLCTNACQHAACGDGIVQPPNEECDDGNDQNDDACLSVCVKAACGDGVLQTGVEECDDGNTEDGCNDVCARDRLVFLADVLLAPAEVTGIDGADIECGKIADANWDDLGKLLDNEPVWTAVRTDGTGYNDFQSSRR